MRFTLLCLRTELCVRAAEWGNMKMPSTTGTHLYARTGIDSLGQRMNPAGQGGHYKWVGVTSKHCIDQHTIHRRIAYPTFPRGTTATASIKKTFKNGEHACSPHDTFAARRVHVTLPARQQHPAFEPTPVPNKQQTQNSIDNIPHQTNTNKTGCVV